MAKQGRPRGHEVNPFAVEDLLRKRPGSKSELARHAGVTPSHLSDMLHSGKGTSEEVIRKMALFLDCRPETIAPSLTTRFIGVRPGDVEAAA